MNVMRTQPEVFCQEKTLPALMGSTRRRTPAPADLDRIASLQHVSCYSGVCAAGGRPEQIALDGNCLQLQERVAGFPSRRARWGPMMLAKQRLRPVSGSPVSPRLG